MTAGAIKGKINVSGDGGRPIYLQLADQIKFLIWAGDLEEGGKLPSTRQLALNLDINRNTVQKAYRLLQDEGYVSSHRGGGTTIVSTGNDVGSEMVPDPELIALIDALVEKGRALGMSPDGLASILSSHARFLADSRLTVMFVECNLQSVTQYSQALEEEFGIQVNPVLIDDVGRSDFLSTYRDSDCAITTFFHLAEVRRLLAEHELQIELFAISVRPHLAVLRELSQLDRGSVVGVMYSEEGDEHLTRVRLDRMTQMLGHDGQMDLEFRPIYLSSEEDDEVFSGLDAALVRPDNIGAMRDLIPDSVSVIEFVNELDLSSSYFLRQVFADLSAAKSRH